MEPVITSTYVLICIATIFVVVVGIFAPRVVEGSVCPPPARFGMLGRHSHIFGWSIFLGGLGMLYSAFTGWDGLFSFVTGELTLFGAAYFIGLLAGIHEEEVFRRRCRSVYKRYCLELMDFFAKADEHGLRPRPDLEFMKRVEQHMPGTVYPDRVIAMRISHARCHLGLRSQCFSFAMMIVNYVRAGGLP